MNDNPPTVHTKLDYRTVYEFAYSQYRRDFQTAYRILVHYRTGQIRSIHSDTICQIRENALRSYLMTIGLPPHLVKVLQ